MVSRTVTVALTFVLANALSLYAADQSGTAAQNPTPIASAVSRAATDTSATVSLWSLSQQQKRPAMLPVLYGTYAVMQGLDVWSTRRVVSGGGLEANPLLKRGGLGTTLAIKAATGAATIYGAERLWKKHRVASVLLMVASNGVTAAVVAHNNRNANR